MNRNQEPSPRHFEAKGQDVGLTTSASHTPPLPLYLLSAILKLRIERLVLRWVTTWKYRLLYVFGFAHFAVEKEAKW